MVIRIRHRGKPPADKDMGPSLARLSAYDAMRKHLDIALGEPRKQPHPVELRQP